MRRHEISDADWDRVKDLLPTRGPSAADRGFVNAVVYVAKTGIPWRDLPDRFGNWNSVWRRFRRWAEAGVWGRVLTAVRDPDASILVLDSTTARYPGGTALSSIVQFWEKPGGFMEREFYTIAALRGEKIRVTSKRPFHPLEVLCLAYEVTSHGNCSSEAYHS